MALLIGVPHPAQPAPLPPVAANQVVHAVEDTPISIELTNGTPSARNQAFAVVQAPQHGSLSGTGATRTYTPDPDFFGADSFTFNARRGGRDSGAGRVEIVVAAVNDAPSAGDDTFATDEDTVLNVVAPGVLADDFDAEGDPISVVAVDGTTVAVGTQIATSQGALVTIHGNGSLTYDPTGSATLSALDEGASGVDSVTYQAGDGSGQSDTATVTITVDGVGASPEAVDDHLGVDENTVLNVAPPGVLVNDSTAGPVAVTHLNGSTTLTGTTALGAAVTIHPNGSFTYDPTAAPSLQALDTGQSADDTFTYAATNSDGQSDTATVTITVDGVGG